MVLISIRMHAPLSASEHAISQVEIKVLLSKKCPKVVKVDYFGTAAVVYFYLSTLYVNAHLSLLILPYIPVYGLVPCSTKHVRSQILCMLYDTYTHTRTLFKYMRVLVNTQLTTFCLDILQLSFCGAMY